MALIMILENYFDNEGNIQPVSLHLFAMCELKSMPNPVFDAFSDEGLIK